MSKILESDLSDLCETTLDTLTPLEYKKIIVALVKLVLGREIPIDDIEWDMLAEREKFEPADTN